MAILEIVCVNCFPFNTNTSGNAINSNLTDYATGTITGIGEVSMTVSDATNTYAIGNFAGFKVNTPSFLAVGAYLYIETYNNIFRCSEEVFRYNFIP